MYGTVIALRPFLLPSKKMENLEKEKERYHCHTKDGSFDSLSCIPIQNNPNATENILNINFDIIFFLLIPKFLIYEEIYFFYENHFYNIYLYLMQY